MHTHTHWHKALKGSTNTKSQDIYTALHASVTAGATTTTTTTEKLLQCAGK